MDETERQKNHRHQQGRDVDDKVLQEGEVSAGQTKVGEATVLVDFLDPPHSDLHAGLPCFHLILPES